MSDLNTEILISANAEGVEAGVGRAKKSLSSLGDTAQKIGKNGADGMQALGAGADMSARKVESATKNMVGSLQRQIAAMEAGDKTSRKYQETLARMRGVDVAALKPYLDQLDSLQNKTTLAERAQASFNSVMLKGAAVFAAAGAIASYVKIINDGVDALNDLKDATGASIENISALEDVGKRAGASFDVVSTSLIKFNNVLSDAKPGSAAEQAIKALGLSIEDLKRLDPAEALRQTSVALNRFADDGDKARLVQELFGKSVKEVAPFLKDLAESGALVAKVTTEQAEQAEKFNKELSALGKNAQDASRALVGPMVSALNDVIAKFKEGREAGKSFLEIANSRYWSNIRDFYGMTQPAAPSTGGATGSWGDGPDSKPSVGPLPDTKKPKGPTKAELSEYDKLIQKLGVDLPKAAAEAEAAQMGYNKAQAEFLALAGSEVWAKFTNSQRATVAALFENKIASEQSAEAAKTLAKANLDAAASREKYLTSLDTGLDKIRADIAAQIEATERMGLSKEAIAELDAAKLEMLATDLELQAIKAMDRNLDQQTYDALKAQAQAYRELGIAKKGGAAKEAALDYEKASIDAAQKADDEWRKTADSINQSLTDALLRGFESGKDFAKNLRDTVVNMFKTLVLRPIISAVVNPVAGALTGALGLSGAAQAATGGASALGMLGNVGSIAAAGLGTFGTAAGYGASALFAGNGIGALAGGAGMVGAGSLAGGFGMIAGVLGPIALGVGALAAIAKATKGETRTGGQFGVAFDGAVTNNRRDQTYTVEGQQFDRDFTNGLQTALRDGLTYRLEGDPVAQEGAIKAAVSGTASGINGILKALGSEARLAGFSAGLETSGKDRGGVFAGGSFADGRTFGESGKGDNYQGTLYEKFSTNSPDFKQALTDFTLDLKQATIQALQSVSDIPKTVQDLLKGVDAEALADDAADALLIAINTQIVGVQQLQAAFNAMGMSDLAALGFDAAAGLAKAAGGFDQLGNGLASYYENFYSESEKAANVTRQVTEALAAVGLEMPKTRDEFRAMVESQVAMGEEGQAAYVTLLNVSGAFASVTTTAETATIAVSKVNQDLMDQLSVLTGAETARSLALRDATDPATKALLEQIYVQQDLKAATEAAATAAAALASTNLGIQDQIDLLTGKETERSLALRDATDSTTKVLLEQLYVQQDLKAAADLAPVIDTTAQALNNLGNVLSRFGDTLNLRSDILRRGAATQGATPSLSFAETRGTNDVDAYYTKTLSEWLADDAARINGYVKDQADAISSAAAKWTGDLFKLATENYDNNAEATVGPAFAASFKKRSAQFDSFFTDLGKFASQLEINLSNSADSAIGATLQLGSIADYFADLATEITTIEKLLAGTAAKAGATFNANEFAGDIAGGAAAVSAAITASILSKVPDAVKNDPALAGVSTNILSLLGSVGKDDVQGINDSFLLLSGALTRGELTSTQYTAAIDYVTGAFTNGVAEAAKTEASLQSVIDQLAQVNREIARVGFTPFENALAEIQDRADEAAKAFGSFAPEITALAEAERTLLNARNTMAADATLGGLKQETDRLGLSQLDLQFLAIKDRADDYKQSLIDLGQATAANIAAVDAWAASVTDAATAANAATAQNTLDGLQREIDRVNFTPLARELASINDRANEYKKSLTDLGQATGENLAGVDKWAMAMEKAARDAAKPAKPAAAAERTQPNSDKEGADKLILGLRRDVASLGMTELQRELADVRIKTDDYIASLNEMGQATAQNLAQVELWRDAMEKQAKFTELQRLTDAAYSTMERSVQAQRKIASELASEVGSVFESLKSAVAELYRDVESTAQQSAVQGQAFIANALSGALATGALPDSKELSTAISGAMAGINGQQYASQFEADRARLVLAGQLAQLQDLAGVQLTDAEKQLESLDNTLETARQQLDALRGIDVSVMSVQASVSALARAMGAERSKVLVSTAAAGFVPAMPPITSALMPPVRRPDNDGPTRQGTPLISPSIPPQVQMDGRGNWLAQMTGRLSDGSAAIIAELKSLQAQNGGLIERVTRMEEHARRTATATNGNPDQPIPVMVMT